MMFERSEYCRFIFRFLQYTQVNCVGEKECVSMRPPLRRCILDRLILTHIIWCRILFWIQICCQNNITPTQLRDNRYLKFCVGGLGKFTRAKKFRKFWYICILHTFSHIWVINQYFSKIGHDSYLMTTIVFWEFERPWGINFWRGSWLISEKYTIFRFCVHKTGMAFETPFVPWGLHFSVPRELNYFWNYSDWRCTYWVRNSSNPGNQPT